MGLRSRCAQIHACAHVVWTRSTGSGTPRGVYLRTTRRRDGDGCEELTAGYGLIIVDECHHVPATTFERAVRQIAAPAWLGLTATPCRHDGLEGLITMDCGPSPPRTGPAALESAVERVGGAPHRAPGFSSLGARGGRGDCCVGAAIQSVFRGFVEDDDRTRQIRTDIAADAVNVPSSSGGRRPSRAVDCRAGGEVAPHLKWRRVSPFDGTLMTRAPDTRARAARGGPPMPSAVAPDARHRRGEGRHRRDSWPCPGAR